MTKRDDDISKAQYESEQVAVRDKISVLKKYETYLYNEKEKKKNASSREKLAEELRQTVKAREELQKQIITPDERKMMEMDPGWKPARLQPAGYVDPILVDDDHLTSFIQPKHVKKLGMSPHQRSEVVVWHGMACNMYRKNKEVARVFGLVEWIDKYFVEDLADMYMQEPYRFETFKKRVEMAIREHQDFKAFVQKTHNYPRAVECLRMHYNKTCPDTGGVMASI